MKSLGSLRMEGSFWQGHLDPGRLALTRKNMLYQATDVEGEELFAALA